MARAMVKKRPVQPLSISPAVIKKVGSILQMFEIDKPFVVLEASENRWVIQLYGEDKPRILTIKDDKPEMI
jgi:hypothetical protein